MFGFIIRRFRNYILVVVIFIASYPVNVHAHLRDTTSNPALDLLKSDIEKVIIKHKNLVAGVVLVNSRGPVWTGEIAQDKTKKRPSSNTMFRTGSVSKIFVALSILKLQEQGKVRLNDKVKDIVPEVKFENKWEESDPVRIVHLLEHTSGWDEIHLAEMTYNQKPPISLRKALDFHSDSRKSRWVPGSRMAYCNSGYAVAAYIVEKVSGMAYEDYVRSAILEPLKMDHSTFFNDPLYQKWGAKTFNWEMKEVGYREELYRPASALNSSADDMATILRILLNRGKLDTIQFLNQKSIKRMESPKATPAGKAGIELGYGLANRTSYHHNFTYHGHDGAIDGGLSEMAYLPESGVGHVILLNANNGLAMQEISALVRNFETGELKSFTSKGNYNGEIKINEGYYVAINPRSQNRFYQDLILSIERVRVFKDKVTSEWILPGPVKTYYPVSPEKFVLENTGKVGLVQGIDPLAGKVLYTDTVVLKPISTVRVFSQIIILALWIIFTLLSVIILLILLLLKFMQKQKDNLSLKAILVPSLSSIAVLAIIVLSRLSVPEADLLLSRPSWLSVSQCILSVFFAIGSILSVIILFKFKNRPANKQIKSFVVILSILHLLVTAYLIIMGIIPMMSWS